MNYRYVEEVNCRCEKVKYEYPLCCEKCLRQYHLECLNWKGKLHLVDDTYFDLVCQDCSDSGEDEMKKCYMSWIEIVHISMYTVRHQLKLSHTGYLNFGQNLCTFIMRNWNYFHPDQPLMPSTWRGSIAAAVSTLYVSGIIDSGNHAIGESGWWKLVQKRPPLRNFLRSARFKSKGSKSKKSQPLCIVNEPPKWITGPRKGRPRNYEDSPKVLFKKKSGNKTLSHDPDDTDSVSEESSTGKRVKGQLRINRPVYEIVEKSYEIKTSSGETRRIIFKDHQIVESREKELEKRQLAMEEEYHEMLQESKRTEQKDPFEIIKRKHQDEIDQQEQRLKVKQAHLKRLQMEKFERSSKRRKLSTADDSTSAEQFPIKIKEEPLYLDYSDSCKAKEPSEPQKVQSSSSSTQMKQLSSRQSDYSSLKPGNSLIIKPSGDSHVPSTSQMKQFSSRQSDYSSLKPGHSLIIKPSGDSHVPSTSQIKQFSSRQSDYSSIKPGHSLIIKPSADSHVPSTYDYSSLKSGSSLILKPREVTPIPSSFHVNRKTVNYADIKPGSSLIVNPLHTSPKPLNKTVSYYKSHDYCMSPETLSAIQPEGVVAIPWSSHIKPKEPKAGSSLYCKSESNSSFDDIDLIPLSELRKINNPQSESETVTVKTEPLTVKSEPEEYFTENSIKEEIDFREELRLRKQYTNQMEQAKKCVDFTTKAEKIDDDIDEISNNKNEFIDIEGNDTENFVEKLRRKANKPTRKRKAKKFKLSPEIIAKRNKTRAKNKAAKLRKSAKLAERESLMIISEQADIERAINESNLHKKKMDTLLCEIKTKCLPDSPIVSNGNLNEIETLSKSCSVSDEIEIADVYVENISKNPVVVNRPSKKVFIEQLPVKSVIEQTTLKTPFTKPEKSFTKQILQKSLLKSCEIEKLLAKPIVKLIDIKNLKAFESLKKINGTQNLSFNKNAIKTLEKFETSRKLEYHPVKTIPKQLENPPENFFPKQLGNRHLKIIPKQYGNLHAKTIPKQLENPPVKTVPKQLGYPPVNTIPKQLGNPHLMTIPKQLGITPVNTFPKQLGNLPVKTIPNQLGNLHAKIIPKQLVNPHLKIIPKQLGNLPVKIIPKQVETHSLKNIPKQIESPSLKTIPKQLGNPPVKIIPKQLETPSLKIIPKQIEKRLFKTIPKQLGNPPVKTIPKQLENLYTNTLPKQLGNPPLKTIPKQLETPSLKTIPKQLGNPPVKTIPKQLENPHLMNIPKQLGNPPVKTIPKQLETTSLKTIPTQIEKRLFKSIPKQLRNPPVKIIPKQVETPSLKTIPKQIEKRLFKTIPKQLGNSPVKIILKQVETPPLKTIPKQLGNPAVKTIPKQLENLYTNTLPKQLGNPPLKTIPKQLGNPPVKTIPKQLENPPLKTIPKQLGNPPVKTIPKQLETPSLKTIPKQIEKRLLKTIPKQLGNPPVKSIPKQLETPSLKTILTQLGNPPVKTIPKQIETHSLKTIPKQLENPHLMNISKQLETPSLKTIPKQLGNPPVKTIPKQIETPSLKTIPKQLENPHLMNISKQLETPSLKTIPKQLGIPPVKTIPKQLETPSLKTIPKQLANLPIKTIPKQIEKRILKSIPKQLGDPPFKKMPRQLEKQANVNTLIMEFDKLKLEKINDDLIEAETSSSFNKQLAYASPAQLQLTAVETRCVQQAISLTSLSDISSVELNADIMPKPTKPPSSLSKPFTEPAGVQLEHNDTLKLESHAVPTHAQIKKKSLTGNELLNKLLSQPLFSRQSNHKSRNEEKQEEQEEEEDDEDDDEDIDNDDDNDDKDDNNDDDDDDEFDDKQSSGFNSYQLSSDSDMSTDMDYDSSCSSDDEYHMENSTLSGQDSSIACDPMQSVEGRSEYNKSLVSNYSSNLQECDESDIDEYSSGFDVEESDLIPLSHMEQTKIYNRLCNMNINKEDFRLAQYKRKLAVLQAMNACRTIPFNVDDFVISSLGEKHYRIDEVFEKFRDTSPIVRNPKTFTLSSILLCQQREIPLIKSPLTFKTLKQYIWRDYESAPRKLQILRAISKGEIHPIDYCYIRLEHIVLLNKLCEQFFWKGINVSDVLNYPDFSVIAMYRKCIVGFAFLVPGYGLRDAYIPFVFTHPDWTKAGIAKFMMYHLLQSSKGKDIQLHVSVNNAAAMYLYQSFGFKCIEYLVGFYDRYLPKESTLCRNAFRMKLNY